MGQTRLRILQVLAGLHLGGAEQLTASMSRWLQQQGHEVLITNITAEQSLLPVFVSQGLTVVQAVDRGALSRFYPKNLVRALRRFQPDVVHCHNMAWLKTAVACRWTGVPCVFTLHGYHRDWLTQHRRWLKIAARWTDYCVGVAPGVEQLVTEILGVPPHRAVYIRNGVPDIFRRDVPEPDWRAPIPRDAVIMAMVARFDGVYKDQMTLVHALHRVGVQLPDLHLVLIGDGPHRAAVEAQVCELGLQGRVHFLGLREDVSVLLHHIHLFVLSSRIEGESLAILEAMSAAKPIIATAVGGTPGLLADGECGILVPPEDAEALAQAIRELVTNKEKAQQLARRARERFLQEYTIDRMAQRYLELYERAAARRKHRDGLGTHDATA